MAKRATSSRIAADIELTEIVVTLSRFDHPKVELRGRLGSPADKRLTMGASVVIETTLLPPSGEAFIADMKAMVERKAVEHERN